MQREFLGLESCRVVLSTFNIPSLWPRLKRKGQDCAADICSSVRCTACFFRAQWLRTPPPTTIKREETEATEGKDAPHHLQKITDVCWKNNTFLQFPCILFSLFLLLHPSASSSQWCKRIGKVAASFWCKLQIFLPETSQLTLHGRQAEHVSGDVDHLIPQGHVRAGVHTAASHWCSGPRRQENKGFSQEKHSSF